MLNFPLQAVHHKSSAGSICADGSLRRLGRGEENKSKITTTDYPGHKSCGLVV